MESFFSTLKSDIFNWLNSKPAIWLTNTIFVIICAVNIFYVIWSTIQRNPSVPPPETSRNIHEGPKKPCKKRRRSQEMAQACKICLEELEEIRKMVLVVDRYLRKHTKMKDFLDHHPPWRGPDYEEDHTTMKSPNSHQQSRKQAKMKGFLDHHPPWRGPDYKEDHTTMDSPNSHQHSRNHTKMKDFLDHHPPWRGPDYEEEDTTTDSPNSQRQLRKYTKMKNISDHRPPCPGPDSEQEEATTDFPLSPPPPSTQFPPPLTSTPCPSLSSFSTSIPLLKSNSRPSSSRKCISPSPSPPPLSPPFSESGEQNISPPFPTACSVLCTSISSVQRSDSQYLPPDSIPNDSSQGSLAHWPASSIKTLLGLGQSDSPGPTLSWWEMSTKTLSLPTSSPSESQEKQVSHITAGSVICREPENKQAEAGYLSFISPDCQRLLEMLINKKVELRVWKRGRKLESFEGHLNSLGKLIMSQGDEQDSIGFQSSLSMKCRSEQILGPESSPHPESWRVQLRQTVRQLYWGLPFLHSESLVARVRFADPLIRQPSTIFNPHIYGTEKESQDAEPSHLTPREPLPDAAAPARALTAARSPIRSETHMDTEVRHIVTPPSSPPGEVDESFPDVLIKGASSLASTPQNRECHLLKTNVGSGRILSSMVPTSQQIFNPQSFDLQQHSGDSQTQWPVSDLPKVLESPETQEKLEGWFHRSNGQLALIPGPTQRRFPLDQKAQDSRRLSRPSILMNQRHPCAKNRGLKCPQDIFFENKLGQEIGHSVGQILRDVITGSAKFPIEMVDSKPMISIREILKLPTMDKHKKDLEKFLRANSDRKGDKIKASEISKDVHSSELGIYHDQSNTCRKTGNLLSKAQTLNTKNTQGLSACIPHFMKVLERHVVKLQVKHRWLLPLKILRSINILKIQKFDLLLSTKSVCASHFLGPEWKGRSAPESENPPLACLEDRERRKESLDTSVSSLPMLTKTLSVHVDTRNVRTHHCRQTPQHGPSAAILPTQRSKSPLQTNMGTLVSQVWNREVARRDGHCSEELSSVLPIPERKTSSRAQPSQDSHQREALQELSLGSQLAGVLEDSKLIEIQEFSSQEVPLEFDSVQDIQIHFPSCSYTSHQNLKKHTNHMTAPAEKTYHQPLALQVSEKCENNPPESINNIHLQDCANSDLLQDCARETLLQDCCDTVCLAADLLPSHVSKVDLHSVSTEDTSTSKVLPDLTSSKRRRQGHQESPKHSLDNISTPTHEKMDVKYSEVEVKKQSSGKRICQSTKMRSHLSHENETPMNESCDLRDKEQEPTEHSLKNKFRGLLEWFFPTKDQRTEDQLRQSKPTSSISRSLGAPGKSRGLTAAAEALKVAVGHILEEKITPQQPQPASNSSWCREKHRGGQVNNQRSPCQESREMLLDTIHKDILKDNIHYENQEFCQKCNMSPKEVRKAAEPSEFKSRQTRASEHHQHRGRHSHHKNHVIPHPAYHQTAARHGRVHSKERRPYSHIRSSAGY